MELHWRAAKLLRIERRSPLATTTGKILHLQQSRPRAPPKVPVGG